MTVARDETPFERRVNAAFTLVLLSGAAAIFVKRFGMGFVVTPLWHTWMIFPAQVIGLLFAAYAFRYIRTAIQRAGRLQPQPGQRRLSPDSPVASLLSLVFVCLGYALGTAAISPGLAMVSALLTHSPQQVEYLVTDADATSRRGCGNAIAVSSQPLGFARLCRLPFDLQNSLRQGDRVNVAGNGSAWGFFADGLQKVE